MTVSHVTYNRCLQRWKPGGWGGGWDGVGRGANCTVGLQLHCSLFGRQAKLLLSVSILYLFLPSFQLFKFCFFKFFYQLLLILNHYCKTIAVKSQVKSRVIAVESQVESQVKKSATGVRLESNSSPSRRLESTTLVYTMYYPHTATAFSTMRKRTVSGMLCTKYKPSKPLACLSSANSSLRCCRGNIDVLFCLNLTKR